MGLAIRWSGVQVPPSYNWLDLLFGWLVKSQVQLLGHTSVNSLLVYPRPVKILNSVSSSPKNPLRVADKYKLIFFSFLFSLTLARSHWWGVEGGWGGGGQTLHFLPTTANAEKFFSTLKPLVLNTKCNKKMFLPKKVAVLPTWLKPISCWGLYPFHFFVRIISQKLILLFQS